MGLAGRLSRWTIQGPLQRLKLKFCGAGRKTERTVKEAAAEDSASAIRQAYLAALQRELASLYQLMAQLDALAGHPLPAGAALKVPLSLAA